ncbi:MAG: class II glutamine amidotransferase [Thermoplasmata archaeon]
MCRLFGSLNVSRDSLRRHLISSPCSLLSQSNASPHRLQADGWGLAYYLNSGRAKIVRSTLPIFEDKDTFFKAVDKVGGRIVLAHIRRASNPCKLPLEMLRRPENIQPFSSGRWVFVHNGTINYPDRVAEVLGRYKERLRGTNDSEVYFWLMMAGIRRTVSVRSAFLETWSAIIKVWSELSREERRRARLPYIGLNFILSDGKKLYALCKYDGYRPKGEDNWLCGAEPPRPLFEMCYRLEDGGRGLVVASERTEPVGRWVPLRDGTFLEAQLDRGKVRVEVGSL